MIIKKYFNIKKAVEAAIKEDNDYILIRHSLNRNEKIKSHYHKKAEEWLIIDSGSVKIIAGGKERVVNSLKKVCLIRFRPYEKHELISLSPISYLVIRDKKDKSFYC